jgi:hypothetical protein
LDDREESPSDQESGTTLVSFSIAELETSASSISLAKAEGGLFIELIHPMEGKCPEKKNIESNNIFFLLGV